jgi:hypothetical protein
MPKKQEPLPKGIQIVQFEAVEFRPLVVASKNIEMIVKGYSAKSAANDRSRKLGPPYYMIGGTPYYLISELIEYFTRNRVETTNE